MLQNYSARKIFEGVDQSDNTWQHIGRIPTCLFRFISLSARSQSFKKY